MRPVVFNWVPAAVNNLALLQDVGAAGPLLLNGPDIQVDGSFSGNVRQVTLTSANNLSAANFTITGFDLYSQPLSEVLAGPNANTVTSVNQYSRITSITVSAPVAAVSVGLALTGVIGAYQYNHFATNSNLGAQVIVTGVITYSLCYSFNEVPNIYAASFTPVVAMTAATTSQMANVIQPTRYVYIRVTASNLGGGLIATLIQQGLN
jgi:hypothetical protein